MKAYTKVMTLATAASLSIFSLTPSVLADGLPQGETETDQKVTEDQQTKTDGPLQLSLDDVVTKALANDNNLTIIQAKYAILNSQNTKANRDYYEMKDDLDDLWDSRDNLSRSAKIGTGSTINTYTDSVKQLEDQLEQLKNSRAVLDISEEQAKVGLRFQTQSRYVSLLSAQKQIELAKENIDKMEQDLLAAQLRAQYGIGSENDIDDINRKIDSAKKELEQQQDDYQLNVRKLLLDINVPAQEDVELTPVTEEDEEGIEPIEKPEDITQYIEESFAMKQAKKALELAEYNLETLESYDYYGKQQAEKDILIKQEEIKQLGIDLQNQMNTLYHDINTAYRNVKQAEKDVENAKEDYEETELSYQLGIISKFDYENADLLVEQAETQLSLAKNTYFLLQKQLEAMKSGLVQTGSPS